MAPISGLESAATEVIAAHERILAILSEAGDAKQEYEKFLHGYILFHCSLPRYKNAEISGAKEDA